MVTFVEPNVPGGEPDSRLIFKVVFFLYFVKYSSVSHEAIAYMISFLYREVVSRTLQVVGTSLFVCH